MKLIKLFFMVALLIINTHGFAAESSAQLNELLSNFHSMSASFTQKSIARKGAGKTSSGTMALERPGKFRWEVMTPSHQIILADGKNLWVYDIDLAQATKQSLSASTNSPAMLLSGSTASLEQRFKVIDAKGQENKMTFRLKPRRSHDMVQSIDLVFLDKKLNQLMVVDNLGQKNIFYFNQVKVNPKLADRLFRFKVPGGVDIIRN